MRSVSWHSNDDREWSLNADLYQVQKQPILRDQLSYQRLQLL